ncbi:hypothetical protein [Halomonas kalidii]|uniref:Uncharacterized protein n=1 Tax=Halomonas kalidii TaxID=3043293 RepID=A0ABT6VN24_9GAMM|nr:hypothetical protein [Halomonas kalidii]MDI5934161.1 hypothetical protein [Halomonas kalidii]
MPAELLGRRCGVVISTPLQYLNALELVEGLGCRERYLVILKQHYSEHDYLDLPGFSRWARIDIVSADTLLFYTRLGQPLRCLADMLNDFSVHQRIARVLPQWPAMELFVIGNPHEVLHQDFASLGGGQQVLICDDGTTSLAGPWIRSRCKWLRRRLLGISPRLLEDAWHFTAYPATPQEGRVLHNRYAYLRSLLAGRSQDRQAPGEIWFLGQPLVEFGVTTLTAYAKLVQGIRESLYADQRIRYWPHPRESEDNLARLADITGVEVASRAGPIELVLARQPTPPDRVATLYSSAYQTCHLIFGGAVAFDIFEPHEDHWHPEHSEVRIMRDCYAYFRRHVQAPHRLFCQDPACSWRRVGPVDDGPPEAWRGATGAVLASVGNSAERGQP